MPTVRTFIALKLSPEVLALLEQIQTRLKRGPGGQAGRWVDKESIHLTLKFLGDVPAEQLEAVYQAVQRACAGYQPFVITVGGVGCFPNTRQPRVVWAGVQEETGQLLALQQAIERELERLGFPRESRKFTAHLTLARARQNTSRQEVELLGRAVAGYAGSEFARARIDEVSVIRSDLRPEGPLYTTLFKVLLEDSLAL